MKPSDRIRELSKPTRPGEWKTDDCDPRAIVAHLDEDHGRLTERLEYLEGMVKSLAWFLGEGGAARDAWDASPAADKLRDAARRLGEVSEVFTRLHRDAILRSKPITSEDVERVAEWLCNIAQAHEFQRATTYVHASEMAGILYNFADREFGK